MKLLKKSVIISRKGDMKFLKDCIRQSKELTLLLKITLQMRFFMLKQKEEQVPESEALALENPIHHHKFLTV